MHNESNEEDRKLTAIEKGILSSKWILIPFYVGLILILGEYAIFYSEKVYTAITNFKNITNNEMLMIVLELVDMAMIANLTKMIITGSFNSFVHKFPLKLNENISSGMLKIKMSTSLIGVSSIHLLKSFIDAEHVDWNILYKQLAIHGAFILGALCLSYMEKLHNQGGH